MKDCSCSIRYCKDRAASSYTQKDGSGAIALCRAHAASFITYIEQPIKAGTGNIDLRDWFAGLAMQSMNHIDKDSKLAELAYAMADAMMTERAKNEAL